MTNKIEDLLKPRIMIIAPWPGMELEKMKVGDILYFEYAGKTIDEWNEMLATYPHLFKPLAWYEHRDESEMPEYVWYDAAGFDKKEKLQVLKVKKWVLELDGDMWASVEGDEIGFAVEFMKRPATLADYTEYINSKK